MKLLRAYARRLMAMEKLRKEMEEWKEWLIEDLKKIIKEEIEKDVEVLFDCLWNKRVLKER